MSSSIPWKRTRRLYWRMPKPVCADGSLHPSSTKLRLQQGRAFDTFLKILNNRTSQSVNVCRATTARTPTAARLALATSMVARCVRVRARNCRAAVLNSASLCHCLHRVAQPRSRTRVGKAIRNNHNPVWVRAAYHITICWAVCAGSYCCGCRLRTNRAVMNRPAGEIRRSSTLAVNNRATLIRALYRKVRASTSAV
jgi:hypothetical protein